MRRIVANVSHGTTLAFVLVGWVCLIVILPLWPASWWYSLDKVEVTDQISPEGGRVMVIDRTIRRPFIGDYRVEEQLMLQAGTYFTAQVCKGEVIRYRVDASLPPVPTLEWWKGDHCTMRWPYMKLPAGTYRICTWVTVRPAYFPEKEVSICSNDFSRGSSP